MLRAGDHHQRRSLHPTTCFSRSHMAVEQIIWELGGRNRGVGSRVHYLKMYLLLGRYRLLPILNSV
jgi:hypothetical protein